MVDANILVAGIAWPRFPYEVLRHATKGDFHLVLSETIIEEARYSLAEIKPSAINTGDLERYLTATNYELIAAPTEDAILAHKGLVRDADDIHVALAADTSKVDFLVTQDKDFTDRRDDIKQVQEMLNIIIPGTFLLKYMGWTSIQLEAIKKRTWFDMKG